MRFMVKNIDPIVSPGQYRSHMHSFFGSDAVTKNMPTTEELQKGCPSGQNPNDLSVYWIPTLYYVRSPTEYIEVNPGMFSTYYENIDKAEIPYPANFFAVAGNASARSQSDVDERTTGLTWWCENGPEDRQTRDRALMPRVTCSGNIQVILRFPDCVNPGDIKNYAYSAANGGRCPGGMKRIPQLRFSVRYNVRGLIPGGWNGTPPLKLACGEVGEGRNTWMRVDGARGQGKAGAACTPKDRDPAGGTGDYLESVEMMNSAAASGHGH
ncbi:hypothetical protein N656DRAFT_792289 [Canariomyces notabilis]|uniref:DUF1996 domain-containing protein n=1 Tax=Canariomyces notabilis TaxID=2074819 RepID=A0AAN6QL26_9PEZI|nr:hypothetical protein N656DRAFT_792289 [Canariomyces arenarius]